MANRLSDIVACESPEQCDQYGACNTPEWGYWTYYRALPDGNFESPRQPSVPTAMSAH